MNDTSLCKIGPLRVVPVSTSSSNAVPFRLVLEPGDAGDRVRREEIVELGTWGIGGSLPLTRNQAHYANLIDLDEHGYLGPGPKQTKIGLSADNPISTMFVLRDGERTDSTRSATAGSNSTKTGNPWTNPGNITASDDARATVTVAPGIDTDYLVATGPAYPTSIIPAFARIIGIQVRVEGQATQLNHTLNAQLAFGGTRRGQIKTVAAALATGGSDNITTLGGATDTWQLPLTGADINGSNLALWLWVTNTSGSNNTFSIDHVDFTVTFLAAHPYLYAAGGTECRKIRLVSIGGNPAFGVVETKTFSAAITDGVALKNQGAISESIRYSSSPGLAEALLGFGRDAGIEQIDTVGYNSADTYRAGAKTAYAERFGLAQSTDNTSTLVWKSTGVSGQNTGAFCRIQSAPVPTASTDLTASGSWGTLYQIGEFGTSINALVEFENSLKICKPEGVYHFNTKYVPALLIGMNAFKHDANGAGAFAWGDTLVVPSIRDLLIYPPVTEDLAAGLRALVANQSEITGYPTAAAAYGGDLYVAFYNETNSYICKLTRRRAHERAPHPLIVRPVVKVSNYKVRRLFVTDNGQGTHYVFYDCPSDTPGKYDVAYFITHPASARTYQALGLWESTLLGSPRHRFTLESLVFDAEQCDENNYWTVSIAWDRGDGNGLGSYNVLGYIKQSGRSQIDVPPLADFASGYTFRLRLSCSALATASSRPRIRGVIGVAEGDAGILLRGTRHGDDMEGFELTLVAGQGQDISSGRELRHPQALYRALRALRGTVQPLVYEHWFGDTRPRMALIQQIGFLFTAQDSPAPPQRLIQVRGRLVQTQPPGAPP